MAIKVLKLNDWRVKLALRHEALQGKKCIARGVFSAIYEGSKPNTVFKVTVDSFGYWMLNCAYYGVKHKHFPRIIEDHGVIGEIKLGCDEYPIYLFEMERLEKLEVGSGSRKVASGISSKSRRSIGKSYSRRCLGDNDRASVVIGDMKKNTLIPRSIRSALGQLTEFCVNYPNASVDMHLGNFMQRKNGDVVITDPLMDGPLYDAMIRQFQASREPRWQL